MLPMRMGKNLRKKTYEMQLYLVKASWGWIKALADLFMPDASSDWQKVFSRYQRESASAEVATGMIKLIYQISM